MNFGDMDFSLLEKIAKQMPPNILIQFHSNGEPLLYPWLADAMELFPKQIKTMDTNGKLLVVRAAEIIDTVDTLTVSVFENDDESEEQYASVLEFLELKGDRKPFMIYRLLGDVSQHKYIEVTKNLMGGKETRVDKSGSSQSKVDRWYKLPGIVATRILHNPLGSYGYEKKVTVSEHGVCLDLLSHLVIDRVGNCFTCVRFNPYHYNKLGNIRHISLEEIWNHPARIEMLRQHAKGKRSLASPLCAKCDFYGCPTGR